MNTDFVKTRIRGAIGVVTLDRPNALNALDQPMCLAIDAALTAWAADDGVAAVVIHGSTERAFCAGGDVRMVREDGLAWKRGEGDGRLGREFFRDEYRMNRRIKTFPQTLYRADRRGHHGRRRPDCRSWHPSCGDRANAFGDAGNQYRPIP